MDDAVDYALAKGWLASGANRGAYPDIQFTPIPAGVIIQEYRGGPEAGDQDRPIYPFPTDSTDGESTDD